MDLTILAANARAYNQRIIFFQAQAVQESEKLLVSLNRGQMLLSKTAKNTNIKNKQTGGTLLSIPYQKKTGKKNPNLHLTGVFQKDMFLETNENAGTYAMGSFDEKTQILIDMYSTDIFGLTPSNKKPASEEASNRMFNTYKKLVWTI